MIDCVSFFVPGEVKGKGRPRFVRATGRTYTPEATTSYENLVKCAAHEAMRGRAPWTGPVAVHLEMRFRPPQSWQPWKVKAAIAGQIRPTIKPDFDNALKVLGDALNGIVWADDTHVVLGSWAKLYAETPGMLVTVNTVYALPAQTTRRADLALVGSAAP